MYTHRISVDMPNIGRCLVFFEYVLRTLPGSGKAKAYSPTLRNVIEFDFENVVESEVLSQELV